MSSSNISPLKRHNKDAIENAGSPAKKEHVEGSGDELDFDAIQLDAAAVPLLNFDDIKKEEIQTKGLAECKLESKDANVRVQVIRVKLDKDFPSQYKKGSMSHVFSLLVEDGTGATHVCSFGDSAKRLKNLLGEQRECEAVFENLEVRECKQDFQKFLPGTITFEFHFVPRSTVHFPGAPQEVPKTLAEMKGMLGRRNVAVNVVVMEKFTEVAQGDARSDWTSVVTDGTHMAKMVVPYAPHFSAGDEIRIHSAVLRYTGGAFVSIKDAEDAVIVSVDQRKVPRKGLKRSELQSLSQ